MRKSNYENVRKTKKIIGFFEVMLAILVGTIFSFLLFKPYMVFGSDDKVQEPTTSQQEEIVEPKGDIIVVSETYATAMNLGEKKIVAVEEPEEEVEPEVQVEAESEEPVKAEPEQEPEVEQQVQEVQDYSETKEFQDRCRLTYAESGLEDEIGQVAVAATILNRQYSPEFHADGNFYNVMNNGFSSVHDGEIFIMTSNPYVLYYEDVPERTIRATERALNGEDPTEQLLWEEAERLGLDPEVYAAGGAKYFYNPNACSEAALAERANIKCKVQIGNHVFYKVWDQ